MKVALRNMLLITLTGFLVMCDEKEDTGRDFPRLKTLAVTEINSDGAKFNAEFINRGDFEITEYGFVWGENENPFLEYNDRVIISNNIQSKTYSEQIRTTLKADTPYYVRAFVKTKDLLVYGENVNFLSLGSNGPEINGFNPKSGNLGDLIKITGANFGRKEANIQIKFGDLIAEIVEFGETEITVKVPDELSVERSTLSIAVSGNLSSFNEEFTLLKPVLSKITPTDVSFGSSIEIEGTNFNSEPGKISLEFTDTNGNRYPAEITSASNDLLIAKIPDDIRTKQFILTVFMNNFEISYDQKLSILDPVITSLSPLSVKASDEITIVGENFSPVASNNIVRVDGYPAEIISSENNQLIVKIPDQNNHIYSSRELSVSVRVFSAEINSVEHLTLINKWLRVNNFPFTGQLWKGLTINGEGYVLGQNEFWKFNPLTGSWTKLTAFPDPQRYGPAIFSVSDKIYLGTGNNMTDDNLNDFWEYDIQSDTWVQKEDFPGSARIRAFAFSIGNDGYIGAGHNYKRGSCCSGFLDFWKYDSTTGTWTQKTDFPSANRGEYASGVAAVLNGEAYVGLGSSMGSPLYDDEIYKYEPVNDTWTNITDYPGNNRYHHMYGVAASIKDQVFFGSGIYLNDLWSFDGSNWTAQESNTAGRNGGFSFVIDDIGYFGGGDVGNQMWVFDISQPD